MTKPAKNKSPQAQQDPDVANALNALKRAARKVREDARRTGIPVVYMKNGKIVEELITEHTNLDD